MRTFACRMIHVSVCACIYQSNIEGLVCAHLGFPGGSVVKNQPANAGVIGLIPGSGKSPGEGNCNPLQCSCLGNSMDGGAWQATVHGAAKSWTQLNTRTEQCEGTKETHRSVTEIIFLMKYFIK